MPYSLGCPHCPPPAPKKGKVWMDEDLRRTLANEDAKYDDTNKYHEPLPPPPGHATPSPAKEEVPAATNNTDINLVELDEALSEMALFTRRMDYLMSREELLQICRSFGRPVSNVQNEAMNQKVKAAEARKQLAISAILQNALRH
jgi:hypothetical protein